MKWVRSNQARKIKLIEPITKAKKWKPMPKRRDPDHPTVMIKFNKMATSKITMLDKNTKASNQRLPDRMEATRINPGAIATTGLDIIDVLEEMILR